MGFPNTSGMQAKGDSSVFSGVTALGIFRPPHCCSAIVKSIYGLLANRKTIPFIPIELFGRLVSPCLVSTPDPILYISNRYLASRQTRISLFPIRPPPFLPHLVYLPRRHIQFFIYFPVIRWAPAANGRFNLRDRQTICVGIGFRLSWALFFFRACNMPLALCPPQVEVMFHFLLFTRLFNIIWEDFPVTLYSVTSSYRYVEIATHI